MIELEHIYKFNELYDKGVRPGDIVAVLSQYFDCGISWDYILLRDGFPDEYNAALCCYKDPRNPEKMHLYQVGFHWCGSLEHLRFRIVNDEEKKDFVNACISRLKTPMTDFFRGADIGYYAQILNSMLKWNLISKHTANKLNKELEKIHGVNLLKLYRKNY